MTNLPSNAEITRFDGTNLATHLPNLATHLPNLATHLPTLATHLPNFDTHLRNMYFIFNNVTTTVSDLTQVFLPLWISKLRGLGGKWVLSE